MASILGAFSDRIIKWVTVLLIGSVSPVFATSISIVVSADQIVISADGIITGLGNGQKITKPFCKIRAEGNRAYTGSGVFLSDGLDLWAILQPAARSASSAQSAAEAVESPIYANLPRVIAAAKSSDPDQYARWLAGFPIVTASFADFVTGMPVAATVSFRLDQRGQLQRPVLNIQGISQREPPNVALLGYNDAMRKAVAGTFWHLQFSKNPTGFSRGLIQSEIDMAVAEHRSDVGPPISVMVITRKGPALAPGLEGACR